MRVNREKLLQELESVQPGLSPREIVEQSSCFVFQGGEVITYNDEISCAHETSLKLEGAVQAEPLLALLRKLNEDDIDVEQTESELIIEGKRRKSGIRMEQEVMLPIEHVEQPEKWKDLPEDFSDAVRLAQECASADEEQFVATCVHLHPRYIEASDNYQILRFLTKTGLKEPTLIRRDSIKHTAALGMTQFSETPSWIHFQNPVGLVLSCRRYEDEFFDLDALLEMEGDPITLPKGLAEAAEKADIFSSQNNEHNQVSILLRSGKMRIRGEGVSGWYSEIKNVKYEGDPLEFMISPRLLTEIVKRHNECEISENRLRVNSGKFTYVTVLGAMPTDH